jgi:hypothetical protein
MEAVRVEDSTSIGRSYTSAKITSQIRPGIGAVRRALTTRTFQPKDGEAAFESATLQLCQLNASTREGVLAYFRNTWDLTNTLFSALKTDAVFYSVPDKLRRP